MDNEIFYYDYKGKIATLETAIEKFIKLKEDKSIYDLEKISMEANTLFSQMNIIQYPKDLLRMVIVTDGILRLVRYYMLRFGRLPHELDTINTDIFQKLKLIMAQMVKDFHHPRGICNFQYVIPPDILGSIILNQQKLTISTNKSPEFPVYDTVILKQTADLISFRKDLDTQVRKLPQLVLSKKAIESETFNRKHVIFSVLISLPENRTLIDSGNEYIITTDNYINHKFKIKILKVTNNK